MKKLTLIVILLCMLVYGSHSSAATGATGASFLNIGTDARAIGMGGAFVGMNGGIGSMHYNPSSIAGLDKMEFLATHAQWISGLNYEFLGFASPVEVSIGDTFEATGTAGLSLTYLSTGEIERRDASGNKLNGSYGAYDMAFSFSYAQNLDNRTNLGLNLKIINQTIDGENATGLALDIGGMYRTSVDGLSLGMAVRNLGPGMRFIETAYSLPLAISFGGNYRIPGIQNNTVGLDICYQPFEERMNISLGGEYSINSTFSLRTGYSITPFGSGLSIQDGITSAVEGLSGGIGLNFPDYRFDYAFVPMGALGITHRITFSREF